MPRGLVALSASAVAAIYMAGYLRTQAADASIAAAAVPTLTVGQGAAIATAAPSSSPPPPIVQRQPSSSARTQPSTSPSGTGASPAGAAAAPASTAAAATSTGAAAPASTTSAGGGTQTQAAYKDGSYSGQGTSRRGDVWVSVQVQDGRIANVTITRSTLQYPLRDIANLPAEVVQRQSARVDIVSRATYSSTAFRDAISQALSAATNA